MVRRSSGPRIGRRLNEIEGDKPMIRSLRVAHRRSIPILALLLLALLAAALVFRSPEPVQPYLPRELTQRTEGRS